MCFKFFKKCKLKMSTITINNQTYEGTNISIETISGNVKCNNVSGYINTL